MPRTLAAILGVILPLTLGLRLSLTAATDGFLDLHGIKGESTDKAHAGSIDVLAWDWGVSNSGTTHAGGGAGAGKANFQDLRLTKWADKASPALMQACARGQRIRSATLIARSAGSTAIEYLKIELTEVLVTAVAAGGSRGESRLTENVVLNFAELRLTYTPVIDAKPENGVFFDWDIPSNSGTGGTVVTPPPPTKPVTELGSTLTYVNGAPVATLTWQSIAGATYQVWVANEVGGTFAPYGRTTPSAGDLTTSVTVPASFAREFFRIETVPSQ